MQLPPGSSISENRICRHIGVSRTPVREAIIRLVEDELIEVFPQKGSFVAPIKLSAVRENHFSRKALELAVLRRAAELWSAAHGVEGQIYRRAAGGGARQPETSTIFTRSTKLFIVRSASRLVWRACGARSTSSRPASIASIGSPPCRGVCRSSSTEHIAILDALDAGDAANALERLEYHLDQAPTMLEMLIGKHEKYFVD